VEAARPVLEKVVPVGEPTNVLDEGVNPLVVLR
jgi:hypothetical protein